MAVTGRGSIIAAKPTATWGSAATLGASTGILPLNYDPVTQKGDIVFDEAIGFADLTNYTFISETADPSLSMEVRWNGALWIFLANFIGDDTKTGVGPTYTHTFNWQDEAPLSGGVTVGVEVNNAHIFENASIKIQAISFEPADGFWTMNITSLGYGVDTGGNATNTGTQFDAVTYITKAQRFRFRGNQFRKNSQGGVALASGDKLTDVFDLSLNFSRPLDAMDDVLQAATTGAERRRAEPIQSGFSELLISYTTKTADFTTHIDDLNSANEYKSDLVMSETVGGNALTATWEFGKMVPIDPQAALDHGLRIPMTHTYRLATPSSTPTGLSTTNPVHFILVNTDNLTYETLS